MLLTAALPAAAQPKPPDVFAAALEQVRDGCRAAPGSCDKLTSIHAGYLAELARLDRCASQAEPCSPELVLSTFRAAQALDLRERELPDAASSSGPRRPLLRLSLLLSRNAAQLYAHIAPDGALEVASKIAAYAPKDVDAACAAAPRSDACVQARLSFSAAHRAAGDLDVCEKKPSSAPCGFDDLETIAAATEGALTFYEAASAGTQDGLPTLFAFIRADGARLSVLAHRDLENQDRELQAGVAALSSRADALSGGRGDFGAAAAQFEALCETYRKASIYVDRLASFGYADGAYVAAFRERINAAVARMAAVRAKLVAVDAAAVAAGLAPGALSAERRPPGAGPAASAPLAGPAPTWLKRGPIPAPPPGDATAPPILPDSPDAAGLIRNLFARDPLKAADAYRRTGLSYTVGDPSGRASLVHHQSGKTCDIVAQQEFLASLNLVSASDPAQAEDGLLNEAAKLGFFRKDTPVAYGTSLLVNRRVLMRRSEGASFRDLDAAARRGGMIIAQVDARHLWNAASPGIIGHAVVIIGAEVSRVSGRTLGYYINDSGTNPPGRGRFIPIEMFREAWNGYSKSYAEVR